MQIECDMRNCFLMLELEMKCNLLLLSIPIYQLALLLPLNCVVICHIDEDVEIEMVEEEPAFLKGYGRVGLDLSPVKIVKNPDGSLSQAAMMQSALQKERRELKNAQRQSEADEVKNTGKGTFMDPVADGMMIT